MIARLAIVFVVAVSWAAAQTQCLPVSGAQVLGADLSLAAPALKALPAAAPIASAPQPGSTRRFTVSELQSIAARYSIQAEPDSEVCFRIATAPLNRTSILDSMIRALDSPLKIPGLKIELLDMSAGEAPLGQIEFRPEVLRSAMGTSRGLPVIWRGSVKYAGDRQFAIWAKVKVSAPVTRLVAAENLRAGIPVQQGQVRQEVVDAFPLASGYPVSISQIEGRSPLRPIPSGAEVRPEDLGLPFEVNRGDLVHVEVRCGATRLALTGRAESPGRIGDLVPVRNLESSRIFQARVDGKDSVTVLLRFAEEDLR